MLCWHKDAYNRTKSQTTSNEETAKISCLICVIKECNKKVKLMKLNAPNIFLHQNNLSAELTLCWFCFKQIFYKKKVGEWLQLPTYFNPNWRILLLLKKVKKSIFSKQVKINVSRILLQKWVNKRMRQEIIKNHARKKWGAIQRQILAVSSMASPSIEKY